MKDDTATPSRYWKSQPALEFARARALEWARDALRRRRQEQTVPAQVFGAAHDGRPHLNRFQTELLPLIQRLPADFRALEIGAGGAWMAALFAAHEQARLVLATEIAWADQSPRGPNYAGAFERILALEPRLAKVVTIEKNAEGATCRVHFDKRLALARAAAEHLPVCDNSLDLVYSIDCLEHVDSLETHLREVERVLRPGGLFHAAAAPLYFAPFGHHLEDIFPLPWGHLLWEPEELAEIVIQEAGPREWMPGVPLAKPHILHILREDLNGATPADFRRSLIRGRWRILDWMDQVNPEFRRLSQALRLREALRIPLEFLILFGLVFTLRRETRPRGMRFPMRLSCTLRQAIRKVVKKPRKPLL